MTNTQRGDERLQSELTELRAALRNVRAPRGDEAALRAQFRAARERGARAAVAGRSRWRVPAAAAAIVVLAIGAAVTAALVGPERPVALPRAAEPSAAAPVSISAFQPLQSSPGLYPASAYSVVRVRIPLSAFAVVPGSAADGTVEADLLVGEDGLARAIRFTETDIETRSVADQ